MSFYRETSSPWMFMWRVPRSWLLMLLLVLAGLLCSSVSYAQKAPPSDWWSAIRRDDVSTVQRMLLRGTVDPAAFNQLGNPALIQAAREQSWRVFDVLRIAPGVKVDQANARDETALMYLAILGQSDRAAVLIQAGAKVNRLGWTPLHYAASKAQIETARLLIEQGAIINAPGPDGTTPLMMAALSGKPAMAQLLLSHGADPTMFNAAGETVADWARKRNHTSLAAQLETLADQVAQRRRNSVAPNDQAAQALPEAGAGQATPQAENRSSTDDSSSFSRYFDLGRFEDE